MTSVVHDRGQCTITQISNSLLYIKYHIKSQNHQPLSTLVGFRDLATQEEHKHNTAMNANLLRNLSFHARRLRFSPTPSIFSPTATAPTSFSSRSHVPDKPHSLLEDISNEGNTYCLIFSLNYLGVLHMFDKMLLSTLTSYNFSRTGINHQFVL